jgi:hypothetical protein
MLCHSRFTVTIKSFDRQTQDKTKIMFKNYFKIAWRHLQKNKLYALANIIGLAVGIMSCILIGIYIMHERSFDRFHKNADRIVRVTMDYNFGEQPLLFEKLRQSN